MATKVKIRFRAETSQDKTSGSFTLDDIGLDEESWNQMSGTDRTEVVKNYIDSLEQPYWVLDTFEES